MADTSLSEENTHSSPEECFGNDVHEQALLSSLRSLRPGHSRFTDVGANIGQYSHFADKFLWNTEMICIESNSTLYFTHGYYSPGYVRS